MPSEPFLQPILEEPTLDLESQTPIDSDTLLNLETYKSFTSREWLKFTSKVFVIFTIIGLVCFIVYLGIYVYLKY